jgi:hypothetical protein
MPNWIAVASANHVAIGVAQGFMQVNHGKSGPLRRISPGDLVTYYSPTAVFGTKTPLQAFTAIGRVQADDLHRRHGRRLYPLSPRCGLVGGWARSHRPLAVAVGIHRRQDQLGLCLPLWPVFYQ